MVLAATESQNCVERYWDGRNKRELEREMLEGAGDEGRGERVGRMIRETAQNVDGIRVLLLSNDRVVLAYFMMKF